MCSSDGAAIDCKSEVFPDVESAAWTSTTSDEANDTSDEGAWNSDGIGRSPVDASFGGRGGDGGASEIVLHGVQRTHWQSMEAVVLEMFRSSARYGQEAGA